MPFIQALGFDVFDLHQVVPEFIADVGVKKGEKVDYALKIDDRIVILIEAKPITTDLGAVQHNQLYRYFSVTDARFAILTNGRQFHFFTDIDETNKMDRRPFFVFDLEVHDEADTVELAKFHRDHFNVEEIAATAARLKYVSAAVAWLKGQMQSPEDEFVKLVGRQIHDGMLTRPVIDTLRGAVRGAFAEIIRDHIRERLDVAFPSQTPSPARDAAPSPEPAVSSGDIETTEEELMAFMVVQAIGAEIIAPERITIRDAKSYCGVFVDDTNRKPVCRFHFNAKSVKNVGLFDEAKTEARHMIESVTDLYAMRDDLHGAIRRYM